MFPVFPGGTEIGLEIRAALAYLKEVNLFSAGLDTSNHAPYAFKKHFVLPSVFEAGWIDKLNEIVKAQGIDYIFPAYDDVLLALAENAGRIDAKIVTSPLYTCRITRFKSETYQHFKGVVPLPAVFNSPEEVNHYPVFLKPDRGQGSQGTHTVQDSQTLRSLVTKGNDLLILEYLPGNEFTIDCFSDREEGLLFCGGRERVRTRSGISMASAPVTDGQFVEYALAISENLEFHGAWFFQLKRDANGTYRLLEIAPRIAGAMAFHRVLGVNFPLLSIYEQERIPIEIMKNHCDLAMDRALVNRYKHDIVYSTVYVDLDDTLILKKQVNILVIRFLFQCVNKGVRLVLMTRHDGDPAETLRKHRLSGLFNEIVHLDRSAPKSAFISDPNAILLDDSFSERREVYQNLGIATFDAGMVEMLLDDTV